MRCAFLVLLSTTISCATPYQSKGIRGGYDETQITPSVFDVAFYGNSFTSVATAEAGAMRRAAELTRNRGARFFRVLASHGDVYQDASSFESECERNGGSKVTCETREVPGTRRPAARMRIEVLPAGAEPTGRGLVDAAFVLGEVSTSYVATVSNASVRKEDLDAWIGVRAEEVQTHALFSTLPKRTEALEGGRELWTYSNCGSESCCHNQFFVRDGVVESYRANGRCYTDCTIRPASRRCPLSADARR